MLELRDVTAHYGKNEVVSGASIVLNRGEVVALIGANAAGKSTTLRLIAGLETVQAGRISLNPLRHIDPVGTILIPLSILLFSGGIYLGVITGAHTGFVLVPVGGTLFLLGWAALGISAFGFGQKSS